MVDSHVGTDNFVICEEELLLAETTQRKHKTSAVMLKGEYIRPVVRIERTPNSSLQEHNLESLHEARELPQGARTRGTDVSSAISISGSTALPNHATTLFSDHRTQVFY